LKSFKSGAGKLWLRWRWCGTRLTYVDKRGGKEGQDVIRGRACQKAVRLRGGGKMGRGKGERVPEKKRLIRCNHGGNGSRTTNQAPKNFDGKSTS